VSQSALLEALQQPRGYEIESELWHALLGLSRTQERVLAEILLGAPLPVETAAPQ
jgi:hypothetical protein